MAQAQDQDKKDGIFAVWKPWRRAPPQGQERSRPLKRDLM